MRKLFPVLAAAVTLAGSTSAALVVSPGLAGASPTPKAPPLPRAAIGVFPDVVRFNGSLRGATYESTIGIVNDTARGQWFDLSLVGTAAPWLSVVGAHSTSQPIAKLFVPPLTEGTPAIIKLKVPPTLADGTYTAQLRAVSAAPIGKAKNAVALRVGAVIDIDVNVTATEVLNGKLVNAYTYPKIEVGSKVPFFALVTNQSNVTVLPHFLLKITRPGGTRPVYTWQGTTGEGILPNHENNYEVDWPASSTLTQTLGKYVATLAASFQGKSFGSFSIAFQLVPYGSLHRGGKLLSLKLLNKPSVGGYVEVQASVVSTGVTPEQTTFIGQLYRNGSLVQPVRAPVPILLQPARQPGAAGLLTIPVRTARGGLYRLTGVANFAGAQSAPKTIVFRVGAAPVPMIYEVAAGAVAVALILAVLLMARRRRRRPPPVRTQPQLPPRYTSAHYRPHVPPRSPVGTSSHRSSRRPPEKN
jgi:hypothetical protein